MTPPVWKRETIASPCIDICVIHPDTKLCTGCQRSIEEITNWTRYSDAERQSIMDDLPNRPTRAKRRGGRAAKFTQIR